MNEQSANELSEVHEYAENGQKKSDPYAAFQKELEAIRELEPDIGEDSTITLEDAVLDFQSGNSTAFDQLFHHYERPIKNLSRRMHNDELSSELFEVLFKAAKKFDLKYKAKFNTYFWRCAQNHIGSQRNMRRAQKRGGVKDVRKLDVTATTSVEEQREFYKNDEQNRGAKTLSLNHLAPISYGLDTIEIMDFIEDKSLRQTYDSVTRRVDLENLLENGLLKEKEVAAIRLFIENQNITLEEAGRKLGNITAPAVHVLLRRIAKKECASQLREILAQ